MERSFKESGWTFLVCGSFAVCWSLYLYFLSFHEHPLLDFGLNFSFYSILSVLLVFYSSIALCGFYLIKGNSNVHKIALPLSIVLLVFFPVGTVIGGIYLWQRYKNT